MTSAQRRGAEGARTVTVRGQELRIWTRTGLPGTVPLVLCGGIGTGFELLLPFVDALDPDIGVIGFDVPGIGGSPCRSTLILQSRFSGAWPRYCSA